MRRLRGGIRAGLELWRLGLGLPIHCEESLAGGVAGERFAFWGVRFGRMCRRHRYCARLKRNFFG